MDKQSLDLIEEGQQVDQWAVKQLLSSLRAAEQERDQYKHNLEFSSKVNRKLADYVGRLEHDIESLRAHLKAAQEQEPVGKVRKVAHGGPHAFQMYDNLPIGESEVYVAATIPAQQSQAVAVTDEDDYATKYMDLLSDVLDAKEVMRDAGVNHNVFSIMFNEYSKLISSPRITEQDAREIIDYLYSVKEFINNGVEFGFIRLPEFPDDSANKLLPRTESLLDKLNGVK